MFARLLFAILALPFVELYLAIVVGRALGPLTAIAGIALTSLLGVLLLRTQGLRMWGSYREALSQGRLPHETVLDGLLVLLAGLLLIFPGYLTDSCGLLLLIPGVRRGVRKRFEANLQSQMRQASVVVSSTPFGGGVAPGAAPSGTESVITVEAVEVESQAYRQERRTP